MKKSIFLMILVAAFGAQQMSALAADVPVSKAPYLSCGIGEEELSQVDQARENYNVRLLFAELSGAYITGVRVLVADEKGETVLDVSSAGPYLFVKLTAGKYRVKASYEGRMQEQSLKVRADATQEAVFRW